jgi:hypothetical protein
MVRCNQKISVVFGMAYAAAAKAIKSNHSMTDID